MDVLLSEGLRPLAKGNSQGHDQGFLAIPFVEELRVWVHYIVSLLANAFDRPHSNPENKAANHTLTNFAYLLADRYSDTVRATRSWESGHDDFLVRELRDQCFEQLNRRQLGGDRQYDESRTPIQSCRRQSYHVPPYC